MALGLAANRRIVKGYTRVRENNYDLNNLVGVTLKGRTAGIIGMGNNGKHLAPRLKALGMKVIGYDCFGNFVRSEVAAALDLPEHLEPLLVVAVGKPDEEIVLTDLPEDGNTNYYRDAADVHYVPKRALEDLII